jgi:hypothetical protein
MKTAKIFLNCPGLFSRSSLARVCQAIEKNNCPSESKFLKPVKTQKIVPTSPTMEFFNRTSILLLQKNGNGGPL